MSKLEFVGTKIPPEWIKRLEELSEETKKTRGVILREAIGQYLGLDSDNPDNKRIDPLRSEIEALKARVTALEGKTPLSDSYLAGEKITQLAMDNPISEVKTLERPTRAIKSSTPPTGALTTGELFEALKGKGYSKSLETLGRHLRKARVSEKLPDDLIALGVRADFEAKRSANKKDSGVRWLFLGHSS